MPPVERTAVLVQLQLSDQDVRTLRVSEDGQRIVVYAEGHEVILSRATVERMMAAFPRKKRGNGKVKR